MKVIDPRAFLEAVYMNADLPLSVRMKAAIALLPFTHAKLAVTAVVSEQDFAAVLDRRLERMKQLRSAPFVDATPQQVETKQPLPRLADRRYRRF